MGLRQFSPHILAFEEKANTVRTGEMLCIGEKLRQRCQGAGRDGIKNLWYGVFHPLVADGHGKLHALGRSPEEIAFLGSGFEQSHADSISKHLRQNEPGEPSSRAQIRDRPGIGRDEGYQLG